MSKAEWKATAEKYIDSSFIDNIVDKIKEDLGKIIYEAKKECLEREPAEADESRFSLKPSTVSPHKYEFYFDEKLVGHIGHNEFHGLDIVGNNYTISLEFTPIR